MRKQKLVAVVSSRALFNMDDSPAIFEMQGKEAFCRFSASTSTVVLKI